jgi:hypothetical protein
MEALFDKPSLGTSEKAVKAEEVVVSKEDGGEDY